MGYGVHPKSDSQDPRDSWEGPQPSSALPQASPTSYLVTVSHLLLPALTVVPCTGAEFFITRHLHRLYLRDSEHSNPVSNDLPSSPLSSVSSVTQTLTPHSLPGQCS